MSTSIVVNPDCKQPTVAWSKMTKTQSVQTIPLRLPNYPARSDHIRIVCMSDTHSRINAHNFFTFPVPHGDIFIHAGDFTINGDLQEVVAFNNWMAALPHRFKVVISGNHELSFDPNSRYFNKPAVNPRCLLSNCIYLQDTGAQLNGLKIYGSPWQPEHGGWAFNLKRGEQCLSKWNLIPSDTDILITHGPPLGYGDRLWNGHRAGCSELLSTVQQRVKPMCHIFGHIHEAFGMTTDGHTTFINASTCTKDYMARNPPLVIDVPLPRGFSKWL